MRKLWLAGLIFCTYCASAPINRAGVASLDAANARLLQGCYDCLLEARDIYQRLAVGKARPLVVLRLFEVELLIALREKELALDPASAIGRATALARELPPFLGAGRYLDDVEAVPANGAGWSRREMAAFRQVHESFSKEVDGEIAWLGSSGLAPVVVEYLSLSLDCAYRAQPRPPNQTAAPPAEAQPDEPPLILYRRALCSRDQRQWLESVRGQVPGFAEAAYFLGRMALATIAVGGGGNPHELVAEAQQRFPVSPAATYLSATLLQTVGDCGRALTYYDQTLALKPVHENAWLGRTVCLTDLKRAEEAIDAATRMMALQLDNTDQALYWRAWNRHARHELDQARADIDAARRMRVTEEIVALAGFIEHDQDDLGPAETDLQNARRMSRGRNCRAEAYLGSVFVKRQLWRDAAVTLESAMACYERDVRGRESDLAAVERNNVLDARFKVARITQLRDEIESQQRGAFTAALNAANYFAAIGDLDKAKLLIDVAAKDPGLSSQVTEVRGYIGRLAARREIGP